MKKLAHRSLRLETQTIKSLTAAEAKQVQGGQIPIPSENFSCYSKHVACDGTGGDDPCPGT
jgi:hypothetical protein